MLLSLSRKGNISVVTLRHGLAWRRYRNRALRQTGNPVPMGWDAGIKRAARFIKQWPAFEIDPERRDAYQNRNFRYHLRQALLRAEMVT